MTREADAQHGVRLSAFRPPPRDAHMYEPTFESVRQHPLPDWYSDAKFGVFVFWGLYSVPAFAPRKAMDVRALVAGADFGGLPYAEWYENSAKIPGTPTHAHHARTYGEHFRYEDFAGAFDEQSRRWQPDAWADLFQRAGARYVVLATKHHDGFLLWPSRHRNPARPGYVAARDIVGELTRSISARGLRMGFYYSSALDWSVAPRPVRSVGDLMTGCPPGRAYREYVDRHWKELIDRHEPSVLWSDIGYPPRSDLAALFAYYYNRRPDGVVNGRWFQTPVAFRNPLGRFVLSRAARWMARSGRPRLPRVPHCDFVTTEYSGFDAPTAFKWEACRGIGNSFGYNQLERADDYQTAPSLVRLLVDIVSKNGNLLLNVGPRADGSVHESQVAAFEGIGRWMAVNGDAIYGTRPWARFSDAGAGGADVRYTTRRGTLFVTVVTLPREGPLALPDVPVRAGSRVRLLGAEEPVEWSRAGGRFIAHLPGPRGADDIPVLSLELDGTTAR